MVSHSSFSPGSGPQMLTRKRKAALIVQMLLSDGGRIPLSRLPEHVQETLALELGNIRLVDRETVNAVAEEFAELLSAIGLSAPGGHTAAIDALADLISPDLARRLRVQFGQSLGDPWPKIVALPKDRLTAIIAAESIEVGAVILSKLPVDTAAAVLSALPGEQARRITFAVSQTAKIAPEDVMRIGAAILADVGTARPTAFEKGPVDRLGAILNSSPAATRDDMLAALDTEDADFAKGVRRAIFTFADIPARISPTDIPNILRSVDPDALSVALAAALAGEAELVEAAEFIFANISQRMANQMREDAAEKGTIKPAAGEEAMKAITGVIRAQVDQGLLKLVEPEDDSQAA